MTRGYSTPDANNPSSMNDDPFEEQHTRYQVQLAQEQQVSNDSEYFMGDSTHSSSSHRVTPVASSSRHHPYWSNATAPSSSSANHLDSSYQFPPPLPTLSPHTIVKAKLSKSHARKTPPGHIKRPPNAFILFRSHCCQPQDALAEAQASNIPGTPSAQQLSSLGITDHRHISRITSHLWKSLSPAEKGYWDHQAQMKKIEHTTLHPNYRYKPVQRAKEDVRRRRKGGEQEIENEKSACEEVAMALLKGPSMIDSPKVIAESSDYNSMSANSLEQDYEFTRATTAPPALVPVSYSQSPYNEVPSSSFHNNIGDKFHSSNRYQTPSPLALPSTYSHSQSEPRQMQNRPPLPTQSSGPSYQLPSPISPISPITPVQFQPLSQYAFPDRSHASQPMFPPLPVEEEFADFSPNLRRRSSEVPGFNVVGMKKRGQLDIVATEEGNGGAGGDMMLISPMSGAYGARKFSIGRWSESVQQEINSETLLENDDLSLPFEAYEFDPDFLQSVMRDRGAESGGGRQQLLEPSTFSWSAAPPTKAGVQDEAYHVGSTDYFSTPPNPLLPLQNPQSSGQFEFASHASSPDLQKDPSPLFGTSAFGNSFNPITHSQLSASDASKSYPVRLNSVSTPVEEVISWASQNRLSYLDTSTSEGLVSEGGNRRESLEEELRRLEREAAMVVLRSSQELLQGTGGISGGGTSQGDKQQQYIFLSREQARDQVLIDQILLCVQYYLVSAAYCRGRLIY